MDRNILVVLSKYLLWFVSVVMLAAWFVKAVIDGDIGYITFVGVFLFGLIVLPFVSRKVT